MAIGPTAGRIVEIASVEVFDHLVATGSRRMEGWRVQDVDLRDRTAALLALDPAGALLLGCELTAPAATHLRDEGAVVFADLPTVPIDTYRHDLYTAEELYGDLATGPYESSLDARAYAWSQRPAGDPADRVAAALHDAAVEAALDRALAGRRLVGVMGGHALARGELGYRFAVDLGRRLATSGVVVGTGGGPGAMEAANLGAHLVAASDDDVDAAIEQLATVPSFRPSIRAWVTVARVVRDRFAGGDGGVGVPTWHYGHEPSNVFPAGIAKYVQNSVREATLLRRCDGGIVFLPGAAGTVQEVFQDACENYYADPATVAPMVLVGVEHWTSVVPAWPLLQALAAGRPMERHVALVDTIDEVLGALMRG